MRQSSIRRYRKCAESAVLSLADVRGHGNDGARHLQGSGVKRLGRQRVLAAKQQVTLFGRLQPGGKKRTVLAIKHADGRRAVQGTDVDTRDFGVSGQVQKKKMLVVRKELGVPVCIA